MIQEYPDYFLSFHCIGGACEDSCCIGWEVDIDEESYYYYQTLEGPFGDLIRSRIQVSPEGDYYFPMVEHHRCPFLNKENLCDMILELGEEALCMTCDEYPRYFNRIGDYEQVDISLSCMEVGRLLFSGKGPVTYEQSQVDDFPAEEDFREEIFSGEAFPDEAFPDEDAPVDPSLLQSLLHSRDSMICQLQSRIYPINRRIQSVLLEGDAEDDRAELKCESYDILLERYRPLVPLDRSWRRQMKQLQERRAELEEAETECFHANRGRLEFWFEKLSVYFVYRYHLDDYYDEDPTYSRRLTIRSLQLLWLLLILRWLDKGREALTTEDMIDLAHVYSRQVEHCEENVEYLKR